MNGNIPISIQESFDKYILQLSANKPEGTVRAYRKSIDLFLEFLKTEGIDRGDSIKVIDNVSYIAYLSTIQTKDYSKSSATVYIAGLTSFRNWLVDNQYLETNKFDEAQYKELVKDSIRKFTATKKGRLTTAQTALVSSIIIQTTRDGERINLVEYKRNIAIFQLLRNSDIMPNEICRLKVKDCVFEDYYIRFDFKNPRTRTFTINKEIIDSIIEYWATRGWHNPNDPVFARHDRGAGKKHLSLTTKSLRVIIKEIGANAGFEEGFTPTSLRLNNYIESLNCSIEIGKAYLTLSSDCFKTMSCYYPSENNAR